MGLSAYHNLAHGAVSIADDLYATVGACGGLAAQVEAGFHLLVGLNGCDSSRGGNGERAGLQHEQVVLSLAATEGERIGADWT